jgi:fructose/tagatose bisphosphate aldolase
MLRIHDQQTRQLVASRPLLDAARRSRSAVAALNFYNAETLLAHIRTAKVSLSSSDDIDLRRTFAPAITAVQEISLAKIRICSQLQ